VCLAVPGQIVEVLAGDFATVDVLGVRRNVNVALLEADGVQAGDWVLIHVGFAMTKMDEREARLTLELLASLGQPLTDELDALRAWQSEPPDVAGLGPPPSAASSQERTT
jgi:hydrogenase expression/formation protein HypC